MISFFVKAILNNQTMVAHFLIMAGVNPNIKNDEGNVAITIGKKKKTFLIFLRSILIIFDLQQQK